MADKTNERWCSKHQTVHAEHTHYNSCRFPNQKKYPSWICAVCGKKYSKKQFQVSTWHKGTCEVCGKEASVTEPRDFFYPNFAKPIGERIKKIIKTPCYCCSPIGGKPTKKSKCKVCGGTGKYTDHHYIIIEGKYAYDKDTLE